MSSGRASSGSDLAPSPPRYRESTRVIMAPFPLAAAPTAPCLGGRDTSGDLDELRTRADAGDEAAAVRLAGLLIKQGRSEEAERVRRFGLNPDGSIAGA